ncbi:Serine/threonine protein kinase [Parasponia andersonii]|uniref:Serine/threonine protein kinase n=1 Tax=Parasponia andersonii TaxID=3476 RepID=A0A2P5DZ21_PARAD|nr:Serine/threonine protein kinase [Parasponia andersonii]
MKRAREYLQTQKPEQSIYIDGGAWLRGPMLRNGGFGSVHVALFPNPKPRFKDYPSVLAVKSTDTFTSAELIMEKMLLDHLGQSPFIIRCFGEDVAVSDTDGRWRLNIFLEYASGGSLADLIRKQEGLGLLESQVRRYTRTILEGLELIHRKGFVHCDLKPANVLLVSDHDGFVAKIADLGPAKRANSRQGKLARGTRMYLSPEAVIQGIQEKPSDIWALGCVVLGMLTGEKPWSNCKRLKKHELMRKIATEPPALPSGIPKEAEDFMLKCFERNPNNRPTAEMLLSHPFLWGSDIEDGSFQEPEENLTLCLSKAAFEDSNFIPLGGSSFGGGEEEEDSTGFAPEMILPLAVVYPAGYKRRAILR